jgi:hypothetical protein
LASFPAVGSARARDSRVLIVLLRQELLQLHRWRGIIDVTVSSSLLVDMAIAVFLARLEVYGFCRSVTRLVLPHEEGVPEIAPVVGATIAEHQREAVFLASSACRRRWWRRRRQ